jgi:phosphatidylserine decarboxylase
VVSSRRLSRFVGKLADSRLPKVVVQRAIAWYIQAYGVNVEEMEHPPEAYESFDSFFTRRLRKGVHTIDTSPNTLVSPADSRILNLGRIRDGELTQIKDRTYRLDELLDSTNDAARFARGSYITLYLSPKDYHRVHSPCSGRITHYRYVPGRLYPVNNLGVSHVERLFAINERLITYLDTDHGAVALVMVGAANVGKITVGYDDITTNSSNKQTAYTVEFSHRIPIERGDELGMFHLGSSVVLITANEKMALNDVHCDAPVRVGEALFTRSPSTGKA